MILFCWEIKLRKKRKSARERCDTRGWKREYETKRKEVINQLKREIGHA